MRKLEDEEEIPEKEIEEGSPRKGKEKDEKERDFEGSLWKEEYSPHEEKDSPHEERDSPHEKEEEECPNYAAISVIRLLSLR